MRRLPSCEEGKMWSTAGAIRNVVRSSVLIVIAIVVPWGRTWSQSCLQPPSGMVAWWPGDGDARDIAGGHNGIVTGDLSFQNGLVGQAFRFDDMRDFVSVPDGASL